MVLTLRPTKPEKAPAFDNLADWTVLNDGEEIGRIFEVHAPARPDALHMNEPGQRLPKDRPRVSGIPGVAP